jgi:phage protein D
MPEAPISTRAVYTARPTIRVDSQEYPKVTELLLAMTMTESEGGMAALELRFSNWTSNPQGGAGLAFEDDTLLRLGAQLAVYGGDVNTPQEIFRGLVTGLEGEFSQQAPPELVVLAEDAFQRSRMTRRTQTHENATLAGLAQDLAGRLGLTPVVTGLTGDIGTQVQLNESDLAFLRRLLHRYDADLQVVGAELHVSPRADVRRGTIELAFGSQLRRVRVLADLTHQVTEMTVTGWDTAQGQRISGTSTGANLGPGSGRTGAQLVRAAVGERSHHVGHLAATSRAEAQALADAAFDERARRLVGIDGTAEGNPALRVGAHVQISGMSRRFDNTYYVTRAVHRFDMQHGYRTDFEAECAYLGTP